MRDVRACAFVFTVFESMSYLCLIQCFPWRWPFGAWRGPVASLDISKRVSVSLLSLKHVRARQARTRLSGWKELWKLLVLFTLRDAENGRTLGFHTARLRPFLLSRMIFTDNSCTLLSIYYLDSAPSKLPTLFLWVSECAIVIISHVLLIGETSLWENFLLVWCLK